MWSRRGVARRVFWVQKVWPYVDGWATTSQNVVTEDRPHDDTAWEAYIQWYTLRTQSRVMYIPPQPPASVPDTARAIVHTGPYPVRRDQHYDVAVSLKMQLPFLKVLYILTFTNNFFCSST
jgi:hypothetical protein